MHDYTILKIIMHENCVNRVNEIELSIFRRFSTLNQFHQQLQKFRQVLRSSNFTTTPFSIRPISDNSFETGWKCQLDTKAYQLCQITNYRGSSWMRGNRALFNFIVARVTPTQRIVWHKPFVVELTKLYSLVFSGFILVFGLAFRFRGLLVFSGFSTSSV